MQEQDHRPGTLPRRAFVRRAGLAVAALGSAPSILNAQGTEKRLRFGVIGVGGRGRGHVSHLLRLASEGSVELAAVCDIYRPRLEREAKRSGARGFHDYRELLEKANVDCVVIATPDHWHARMCLDAMAAGCDVYCEKPWTRYAHEAKEVYHAVARHGKILQIGTQHTADGRYWAARDAIAAGEIGQPVWSQISYCRNSVEGEWNYAIDPGASPENLDWEAFLGSAPKKPFNPEHFFRFRKYWDYSGGIATDLHYHKLAPILLALGADFPWRVTSGGGVWVHADEGHQSPREVPDTFMSVLDMPAGHTILLASSMANASGLPDFIRGHEANLHFVGGGIEIRPEERCYGRKFRERHGGKDSVRVPAHRREEHMANFINCVRSRRADKLNCGPDLGYRTMVCIAMSVKAYRENKVLFWDKTKEEIVETDPGRA